ncbi:hypothetical protein [Tropicimonas sp. IMCC6043]|uniref:hypothetical protein n=1 Tax=Tropicimonas sp. IMCC6043 TaxID=2510645 RepID=UPI00101DF8A7|nr:hypothetical protein [Tropicimonas sp. IMCC6043]RYH08201.1 hypothetical protein EU800_17185 [Tropicimonas sp. IMCC6043]
MVVDPDLIFVIGAVLGLLAFLVALNAYTHGRGPTLPLLVLLVSAGMIGYAVSQKQSGSYSFEAIPGVFMKVLRGGPG